MQLLLSLKRQSPKLGRETDAKLKKAKDEVDDKATLSPVLAMAHPEKRPI